MHHAPREFYIDPKVELQLRFSGEPGYICQHPTPTSDVASCVCKLSGVADSGEWNMFLDATANIGPGTGFWEVVHVR